MNKMKKSKNTHTSPHKVCEVKNEMPVKIFLLEWKARPLISVNFGLPILFENKGMVSGVTAVSCKNKVAQLVV